MRRHLVLPFVFVAAPLYAQSHADVVDATKTALLQRGVDTSGACGAFAITKRVAWQLRSEGAGLYAKPAGNNCDGFATDIIVYPDGHGFDILGDAGGANAPGWNDAGPLDATRYRPAIDPGDTPAPAPTQPPVVIVPPAPAPVDLTPITTAIAKVETTLEQHIQQEEAHWTNAKNAWADVGKFAAKYIAPAVAAWFGGKAMAH